MAALAKRKTKPSVPKAGAKIIDFEALLRSRELATRPPNKAFEAYKNSGRGKNKNAAKSFAQLRQRELAWVLYISEGYTANLLHALKVNCVTFNDKDKALIGRMLANIESDANKVRDYLNKISTATE